eukprot:scaffold17523_cov98-Phaeocystis_antarctica.AAC.1
MTRLTMLKRSTRPTRSSNSASLRVSSVPRYLNAAGRIARLSTCHALVGVNTLAGHILGEFLEDRGVEES